MGEPQIFGYAAVRILRPEEISAETKRAVAPYTVAITRPLQDFGVPHGLLAAISYLVAGGHLRGEPLATAIRHLVGTQDVFVGLTTEDTLALTDSLLADEELAPSDIIEAHHEEMPPREVRAMVEQGVQAGKFEIRLRFYKLGLKLYGPDFIRPALEDRSTKVRDWAEKQLAES